MAARPRRNGSRGSREWFRSRRSRRRPGFRKPVRGGARDGPHGAASGEARFQGSGEPAEGRRQTAGADSVLAPAPTTRHCSARASPSRGGVSGRMKLEGIKVVDLSSFLPGPYLTMALADHGAEVIKVEAAGRGRSGAPYRSLGRAVTVFFRNVNRGKKSVVHRPEDRPKGVKHCSELCDTADVLIETFRPGVIRSPRLRLRHAERAQSRLVYCSISAFGHEGTYRKRPAHDLALDGNERRPQHDAWLTTTSRPFRAFRLPTC